jgi:hypothetical protein
MAGGYGTYVTFRRWNCWYPWSVGLPFPSSRASRRVSWVLLAALLPMLTFMGHWPTSVPIPGTNLYVSLPFAEAEGHSHSSEDASSEGDHSQHCHSGPASCGDAPAAAGASFATLSMAVSFAIGGALLLLTLRWWRPLAPHTIAPALRPPRPVFARPPGLLNF